jgi:hypothetical protein
MISERLKRELEYVYKKFDFSKGCPESIREELFTKGLVEFVEGSLMVTTLGEKLLGLYVEDKEEDVTEAFFYMNEGEYDETF